MSDELALATGFYYLSSCYYFMLCVKKYKIDLSPQSTLNLKLRKRRRCWMRTIYRKRNKKSMENIFQKLLAEPSGGFHNFCGMSFEDFEILLQKLGPFISKKDTGWREAIPAKIRLALTLRFLASGESYKSLHCLFKISHQVISKIVMEVCTSLCQVLKGEVKLPATEDDWLSVEKGFHQHFPHAVGAIDGKRVVLRAPVDSSSERYKKAFSIALLALIDSNYCFMFADVGCQESRSDGCILKNSLLWNKMCDNQLRLPAPTTLKNGCIELPYVFLGDDAFALQTNLMKPYPGMHQEGSKEQNFNNKLSSARVIVENVFGIMSVVFKVLSKPLLLQPETAKQVVMSCIILHNFLRKSKHSAAKYNPPGTFDIYGGDALLVPGSWRFYIPENPALRTFGNAHRSMSPRNTEEIRNAFANYLVDK